MHKTFLAIILPMFLIGRAEEKEPLENSFNIGVGALSAGLYQTAGPDFRKTPTPTYIASYSTPSLAEVLSSDGGTRENALKQLELPSRQGACGKCRGQYRVYPARQPARTRHAIGHRCTRMHGTGMALGRI